MQQFPTMKCFFFVLCIMIVTAELTSAAPTYSDYENLRDFYELLLQREALEDRLGLHQVIRKASNSRQQPTLRLRFGRSAQPALPFLGSPYSMSQQSLESTEHAEN